MPPKKKNRKIRFSDQVRARADTRMSSRGLNTLFFGEAGLDPKNRYGVNPKKVYLNLNLIEGFGSKFRFARREFDKSRSLVSATKAFFSKETSAGIYTGSSSKPIIGVEDQGRINLTRAKFTLRRRNGYSKRKAYYQPLIFHEFLHSMHLPNGFIAPSAFESYLDNRHFKDNKLPTMKEIVRRARILEKEKLKIKEANKKKHVREYESRKEFKSPWEVGKELGTIAWAIETRLKQKGIGLFFIREFIFNDDIIETISKISNGAFDFELRDWFKMNPRLARILK